MNNNLRLQLLQFFANNVPIWRNDPVLFFREVLYFIPDDWQIKVAYDVRDYPRTAVRSGQGVGKTGLEAALLLWFLACFPYARVVATAPTSRQLNDVLWSEIDKWMNHSPILPFLMRWTKTYVYMVGHEKRWFATARSATKPENMQGFHEENMLIIVDEASGVSDAILEAIRGTLSGSNNKLLYMGNPTKLNGGFFDAFHSERDLFQTTVVNAENSPRTNKENIEALKKKYGVDSNVVRVRIFGEFPLIDDDVLIPYSMAHNATMNELMDAQPIGRISIGVDVARYGGDETVIAQNIDGKIAIESAFTGQSLMNTTGKIVQLYRRLLAAYPKYHGKIYVNIDDTGLGGGVTDRLSEVKQEENLTRLVVVPVNAAGRVPDTTVDDGIGKVRACEKYDDLTTYMWGTLRDLLQEQKIQLPDDAELLAQLSCRKYHLTSRGKMRLESKDDMKKRSISSPDRADAVALSVYQKDAALTGTIPQTDGLAKQSYWRR